MEQISTLAMALRGSSTLAQLDIIHASRMGGQSVVRLAVHMLNGSQGGPEERGRPRATRPKPTRRRAAARRGSDKKGDAADAKDERGGAASRASKEDLTAADTAAAAGGSAADAARPKKGQPRVDLSDSCLEEHIGRVACAMIGTLIASNTSLETLDLSNTAWGRRLVPRARAGTSCCVRCATTICPLNSLVLTNVQLNDKAGQKLMSALSTGLGKGDCGYEKITSLSLSKNELGKGFITRSSSCCGASALPACCRPSTCRTIPRSTATSDWRSSATSRSIAQHLQHPVGEHGRRLLVHRRLFASGGLPLRLGFLSDAFQTVAGQAELVLNKANFEKSGEDAVDEAGEVIKPVSTKSVIMLLAGVLKFNTSLKSLTLSDTGLDGTGANYFATALQENKVLEQLDLSGNPISGEGVSGIAEAARTHPSLVSIKLDGKALPISQLRGAKGAEPTSMYPTGGWVTCPGTRSASSPNATAPCSRSI